MTIGSTTTHQEEANNGKMARVVPSSPLVDDDALSRSSAERAVTPLHIFAAASSSDWVSCDWEEIESAYDSCSDDNNTAGENYLDKDDSSVRGCTADDSLELLSALDDDEETDANYYDFAGDDVIQRRGGWGLEAVRRGSIHELILLEDRCIYDFGRPEPTNE